MRGVSSVAQQYVSQILILLMMAMTLQKVIKCVHMDIVSMELVPMDK